MKKWILRGVLFTVALGVIGILGLYLTIQSVKSNLPKLITVQDYEPLLVSEVFDRNNKKIGEFFRERRHLVTYKKIPQTLVHAFLAAEDDQFFQHHGINLQSIFRATLANIRAGRSVQGGSTITQQVAKTLLLSSEKTITRKLKDALLAIEMEKNLSKEDILYLYLNQIYFGQSAYGIEMAAQTYFHKPVSEITLPEAAILAGLPQAPSRYSPVTNPQRAKERQIYVLHRMAEVGFITSQEAEKAISEPVKVYVKVNYEEYAPYFLETVRQILVQQIGEDKLLDKGLKIYTSLDLEKQKVAQESVRTGLKELDKRQGYRGPIKNIASADDAEKFFRESRIKLLEETNPLRTIMPDGNFAELVPTRKSKKIESNDKVEIKIDGLPSYIKIGDSVEAWVEKVDDAKGAVFVRFAENRGVIDFETMRWARTPNTDVKYESSQITKPSQALKNGDVILVKILSDNLSSEKLAKSKISEPGLISVELDQEPVVEGALLSFDQHTQEVLAMVGGYDFEKSKLNRTYQARRQTGSSFKPMVYASAIDKGYTPATPIMDAPIVYQETVSGENEGQEEIKTWKPSNHSKSFGGDIILRNALVKSLNVPTVKIIEDIGVTWASEYARRLGVFSPLNMDFTLALGSSGLTLYEMTKVFSQFGRLGERIRPMMIMRVEDRDKQVLATKITMDNRFAKEITDYETQFEEKKKNYLEKYASQQNEITDLSKRRIESNFIFDNPDQLIKPQTAYIMTSLLKGVVEDKEGTGGKARAIGREVAGKTGTTNGYFDAWFLGYTAQIATGVWVGHDQEKSLGKGEVGGRAALPIWVDYMKFAHNNLPEMTLPIPPGIVFANIDRETGKLATSSTKNILKQAFVEGTEPGTVSNHKEEANDFLKQDLSE